MKNSQFLKKRGSLLLSTLLFTTLILPLSTVGFMSFQGYTKDAHSAMMRENIGILVNTINLKAATDHDVTTMIDITITDKTIQVSPQKTIFGEASTERLITKAGDLNWIALNNISRDNTIDQYGNEPLIGYASTSQYSALQVATTIDSQVYVKGNFAPDNGGNAAKGLIQNPSRASELVDGDYGKHR